MPRYRARIRVTEWYEFEFESEDMTRAVEEVLCSRGSPMWLGTRREPSRAGRARGRQGPAPS